ncbi:MAG: pantoate--beta-alanine ligase [Candidatus Omnitrophica bacterium]|nr:pantoate--beta-alanine ligase [Candidatus Omnitrophota bacterium]MDD5488100.1 pantoate--beta-alanine ligase [Candidatus Omnitrophota bacterium]
MKIVTALKDMTDIAARIKGRGERIGFVPTMGYLHEGHASLLRAAREECDQVVMSVFVNPMQFGQNEDLGKYPRDQERDRHVAEKERVDVIFVPSVPEMYPEGYGTYVDVKGTVAENLCGASRPGHFRGVATVVLKLVNIVQPDVVYLGQKDAQQAAVIKKMFSDLNVPARIRVMPIVREPDGLAMSSRNAYLSTEERDEAVLIHGALVAAREMVCSGECDSRKISEEMRRIMSSGGNIRVDYIGFVDRDTLEDTEKVEEGTLIAVAAFLGGTRLIDNVII